jgi:hypothetical protein
MMQVANRLVTTDRLRDGCVVRVSLDGAWEITFPDGSRMGGTCDNQATAKHQAQEHWLQWAVHRWARGRPTPDGKHYIIPLD